MRAAEVEGARVLCSEPYPGSEGRVAWTRVPNGTIGAL